MSAARILVVEDEAPVARALVAALEAAGYRATAVPDGERGLQAAALRPPDGVILDLGLPDMDGVAFCRRLRAWSAAPVVVVSAAHEEDRKIDALDAGADDYVTKPFAVGELLARLRAALRRAAAPEEGTPRMTFGDVVVDRALRTVTRDGVRVHLTPHEYDLLAQLAAHPDRVLTHRALLSAVWGPGAAAETHTLRVHMGNLRRKLERDPSRPAHILTDTGVGYRLQR